MRIAPSPCDIRTRLSRWGAWAAICALAPACASASSPLGDATPPSSCNSGSTIEFSPAVPESVNEAYSCFYYPLDLGGRSIASIHWREPQTGPIRLHHATIQLTSEAPIVGSATSCEAMPADTVTLHVHAPGGSPLEFAPDIGFAVPPAARFVRIEAHALRTSPGVAGPANVEICTHAADPPMLAAWLGLAAPVPAIRPHMTETSTGRCELPLAFHLIAGWPHMHVIGHEFHAAVAHGEVLKPLLNVSSWDFTHQQTYPLDVDLAAHDVIEPTCVWENPTADYVLPGIYTSNEMCTFGLIGWPREAAGCISVSPAADAAVR